MSLKLREITPPHEDIELKDGLGVKLLLLVMYILLEGTSLGPIDVCILVLHDRVVRIMYALVF